MSVQDCVRVAKRQRITDTTSQQPVLDAGTQSIWAVLANELQAVLNDWDPEDSIRLCGDAPLALLSSRPLQVMALAKERVNTWEYRRVPRCWLRLFEDASLAHVISLLNIRDDGNKWVDEVVKVIDNAIIMTGASCRSALFTKTLLQLEHVVEADASPEWHEAFVIVSPASLETGNFISSCGPPTLTSFQAHIDEHTTPLLIHRAIEHWPAMKSWLRPSYLLKRSLGGRRLVPVEIGETYTHSEWRQQLMTLREYMKEFVLSRSSHGIGYMGQHDLFRQIPALKDDISVPDYCFTSPPNHRPATLQGQPPVAELDEPSLNAWLGPKGTKSPLHHDPYHNIFCQVVGYKYVRLYPPVDSRSMYAHGIDEKGINMANTSAVDVKFLRSDKGTIFVVNSEDAPLFCAREDFQEAILAPGDSLYIPAGWWHYFESLTTSFSVSFWWN
ncbi:hypothetical protein B0A48_08327 [Cryoendolithus antarcticus]|uniref:JmjC domain-containing protein n=1 Tax=Cryoendolithus antarcticus TaxID=1507870 RepID=A0A1V8T5H1_9PEZI|nr:hypothetical protein B0A48_08327 [Cryoendolithus antarcticus]